jgi:transcriptional regulator with GAF, ATPase, and Fis domain
VSRGRAGRPSPEATLDPDRPLAGGAPPAPSERLTAIYEIGRQLLAQRDPAQVLQTIHQAIVRHLQPDHACVLTVGIDGTYRPVTAHALDLDGPQEEWPLSRTVLQRARTSGLAVLSSDTLRDAAFDKAGSIHRLSIRSVMCVPLRKDPVRGLVYVDIRQDRRAFTRQDLEFMTAVSLYASLVLERTEEQVRTSEALRLSDERLALLEGELLRHKIVGRSRGLLASYDALRRFARAGARVLLRGETGTGKELFARAYAANSPRAGKAYIPVPIPALAPTLVESELFGHVRGAFTEASHDKKGRFELAHGGVLFLDEVGDVEPALQAKLLRFLDSGELYRVGDTEARTVDALVVSATNRPLETMAADGRFRDDLLARLGQVLEIPPLRERPEDVPVLVEHFLEMYDRGPKRKVFSEDALQALQACRWELNVRQLRQVVERVVCLVDHEVIRPDDLPDSLRARPSSERPPNERTTQLPSTPRRLKEVVDEVEKAHILRTLEFTQGNRTRAIEILQISPETFYRRLEEFGLRQRKG